jgi:hypothetical protein
MKAALNSVLIFGIVLAASPAAADRFTVGVWTGLREQSYRGKLQATPEAMPLGDVTDTAPALEVMGGVRILPMLAIGARFGISQVNVQSYAGQSSCCTDYDGYLRTPIDASVFVQVEYSRVSLAPWLGLQGMHSVDEDRLEPKDDYYTAKTFELSNNWSSALSYGATLAVDVYRTHGNRIALFAGAQGGMNGYSAISFGLGYRR